MKKPPKPKPGAKRTAVTTNAPKADGTSSRAMKLVAGVGTILGLFLTVLHYWPQISVEATRAADVSNPLSGIFKVTNEQNYPINDVNVSMEASLRCSRIGLGDNTAPMDRCDPSMHTTKKRWSEHTLRPHEPYEISPGDLLFVTPGALLYAQLSIFVSYEPWIIPIHWYKEMRFETRRLSDGTTEWLHIPAD